MQHTQYFTCRSKMVSASRFNGVELYMGCLVTFFSGLSLTFIYTGDMRWECEVFHSHIHGVGVPIMPSSGAMFYNAPEYSCLSHTPARYGSNLLAKENCNRQKALNCKWTTGKVYECGDKADNVLSFTGDFVQVDGHAGFVTGLVSGCGEDPASLTMGVSINSGAVVKNCCQTRSVTSSDRDHYGVYVGCADVNETGSNHVPCRNDQGGEFSDMMKDGGSGSLVIDPLQEGRCLPHSVGSTGTKVSDAKFPSYNLTSQDNQDNWKLAELETRKCYSIDDYRLPEEFPNLHIEYQDEAELVHKLLLGVMLGYWVALFARFSYHVPPYWLASQSTKSGFDSAFRLLDFISVTASVFCSITAIIYMHDILRDSRSRTDPTAFDEGGWTEADTDNHFEKMRYAEGFYAVVGFGVAAFLQWIWLLSFLPDSLNATVPSTFFQKIPSEIKDASGDGLFTARIQESRA